MTSTLPATCPHCAAEISAATVAWKYGSVPVCQACGRIVVRKQKGDSLKSVISIVVACLLLCAVPARAQEPAVFAGASFDHGGRGHASAEAWFPHTYRDLHSRAWEVLAGVKPDGTVKLGTGFALMAGEDIGAFVFVDGRAWGYFETSGGGTSGGGFDGGAGVALCRLLLRVGYGMAGTSMHPRKAGVTAVVAFRLYP